LLDSLLQESRMSSTPTLLRVKRRITDDPSDVLVLSATKRRKTNTDDVEGNVKILKLAGTVEQADDNNLNQTIARILNKKKLPNFKELKEKYKKSTKDATTTEARSVVREKERGEERFRVVNTNRSIKLDELEAWSEENSDKSPDSEESPIFHLYDIVKEKEKVGPAKAAEALSCNGVEMIREFVSTEADNVTKDPDDVNYVYDVYYAEEAGADELGDFDDSLLDGLVSLQPFNTGLEFMYDEYRDNPGEFKYEDDEDSNDEDNDRNEYPDEEEDEDFFGDYSDNLDLRVGRMTLKKAEGEEDLSSDDEDELLYTKAFDDDADMHGTGYARYKQRILREFKNDDDLLEDSESDADSDLNELDAF